jgi:PAS domain-containing protein
MFKLYDVPRDEFAGLNRNFIDYVIPEDRERIVQEMRLALESMRVFETEFRIRWRDGSVHRIKSIATVETDDDGVPVRVKGNNWEIIDQGFGESR